MSARNGKVSLPSHFQCPISLHLMKDPGTLSTSDDPAIEQWLIEEGHNTRPVTRQVLCTEEVIPNHALNRIIQSRCSANKISIANTTAASGSAQDQKEPLAEVQVEEFSNVALENLPVLTNESDNNCEVVAHTAPVLASLLSVYSSDVCNGQIRAVRTCEEVIATLSLLDLPDDDRSILGDPKVLSCLGWFLRNGHYEVRINTARLLGKLVSERDPLALTCIGTLPAVAEELVRLSRDDRSRLLATESILDTISALCSSQKNILRFIKAGAVSIALDLLPGTQRGVCEKALALLEILLSCAEGRGATREHALAVPAIVKRLLRVSESATGSAVEALWKICRYSSDQRVKHEALGAGAFGKLVVVLQVNHNPRTKQRAAELLRLLGDMRK